MRPTSLAGLAVTLAFAIGAAAPAKADVFDSLKADIAAGCAHDRIKGDVLAKALLKAVPITLTAADLKPSSGPLARRIAVAAMDSNDGKNTLRLVVVSWTAGPGEGLALPFEKGGLRLLHADGTPVSEAERPLALEAMLTGDDEAFQFVCKSSPVVADAGGSSASTSAGASGGGDAKKGLPFRVALARTPEDVSKPTPTVLRGKDDKSYAEFGFTSDDVKDIDTYTIDATVGLVFGELGDRPLRATPLLFAQVQRKGTSAPTSGGYVNNLNFGFSASNGRILIDHLPLIFYDLGFKFLTDDDFDSRAYQGALKVRPILPLPGNNQAVWLARAAKFETIAWWSATAAADWMQVDDPGAKTQLKTTPEFVRLGYDLSGHILWYPHDSDRKFSVQLDVNYSLRDGQTQDGGDAQLVNAALRLLPDPRYSFGLVYERGENIDTLERIDVWKLVLGARF